MPLCHAHSSKTGLPCRRMAIKGGTVCNAHGGRIAHVRAKARERLDEMVAPALVQLRKLIESADSDSVKLAAIRDVLDRCGYKLPERIETDQAVSIRVEYAEMPMPESGAQTYGAMQNGHVTNGQAHT